MSRHGTRGWALAEATIALAVIVILIAGAGVAGTAEARFAADAARRDAARDTATEALERARLQAASGTLAPGEEDRPSHRRTVREVEPGLLEVAVTTPEGETFTTLVAVEVSR